MTDPISLATVVIWVMLGFVPAGVALVMYPVALIKGRRDMAGLAATIILAGSFLPVTVALLIIWGATRIIIDAWLYISEGV